MFEWEEADRFSFEDSDRFEEDSMCSWLSEPESVVNNWRGWKKNQDKYSSLTNSASSHHHHASKRHLSEDGSLLSLTELAAREVAASIPFELVEHYFPPVPEQLQLRIAFWSFPEQEEDIRLYSCLANGSAEEFGKGEHMLKSKAVKDPLQIGFHLSATVAPGSGKQARSTSVTFDRGKIVSCQCSCNSQAEWCAHVVALCLHRIHYPLSVTLRAPVSESLSRLERNQLQKFAQYLIAELPQQILPTAQKILDELLCPGPSAINSLCGAPDPTAGGAVSEQTSWCLDGKNLNDNIKKILIKFCVPAPIVFSDVNYLSTTAPPSAAEWCSFLRPLRGREPEGMWNLLSIVREMFRRNDRNSIPLLEIITQQCLETAQIMVWWFNTKVALHHRGSSGKQVNSNSQASQNACASLCDEIVTLWKLAALNPCMSPQERELLKQRLMGYHVAVIEKIQVNQTGSSGNTSSGSNGSVSRNVHANRTGRPSDIELFPGFKSAIEACTLDWTNDPIDGITYGHNAHYLCPFAVFKLKEGHEQQSQVNSSQAVLRCEYPTRPLSVDFQAATLKPQSESTEEEVVNNAEEESLSTRQGSGTAADMIGVQPSSLINPQPSSLSSEEGVSDEGVGDEPAAAPNQFESGNEDEFYDEFSEISRQPEGAQQQQQQQSQAQQQQDSLQPSGNEGKNDLSDPKGSDDANEYHVYFYDCKEMASALKDSRSHSSNSHPTVSQVDVFRKLRSKIDDDFEIKFMRAEGVHAHGFHAAACDLAVELANRMICSPPNLLNSSSNSPELPHPIASNCPSAMASNTSSLAKGKRKKCSVNSASHALTHRTSTTLSHCAFLCTVLSENTTYHHLAFQIGMFGLELPRLPASSKPMEVKLAHQESELVTLLKRIPLGADEVAILRDRATQLREGTLKSRGDALLPLMMASYIFESLVITQTGNRLAGDEVLGFEAAVAAIGLKAHVSEAEHPLLCEGTRRQRGDLALLLLVHYKDQPDRLAKIMDKLLDKEIHQLIKTPIHAAYYVANSSYRSNYFHATDFPSGESDNPALVWSTSRLRASTANHVAMAPTNASMPLAHPLPAPDVAASRGASGALAYQASAESGWSDWEESAPALATSASSPCTPAPAASLVAAPGSAVVTLQPGVRSAYDASDTGHGWQRSVDTPSSEHAVPGHPQASSVAGNARSYTMHHHRAGPGSDSGSSGNSSADSIDSSSSSNRPGGVISFTASGMLASNQANRFASSNSGAIADSDSMDARQTMSAVSNLFVRPYPAPVPASFGVNTGANFHPTVAVSAGASSNNLGLSSSAGTSLASIQQIPPMMSDMPSLVRSSLPNIKVTRFKGKRAYPSLPNQPSEASAHFMFELAKQVLTKAGGTSSTSLFTQPTANQNPRGPHRALHMCAFQIGLYALGLHNRVSPNWLSRTYSSHVSWITGQAMEIGAPAISFLVATWEGHLTPPEAASMADKASKSRDNAMIKAASELALSVLPHAAALNPNEIQRAIQQCKEQSLAMLEKACLAAEKASSGGGVYPEVMFQVARHWYFLFEHNILCASSASLDNNMALLALDEAQPQQPHSDHVYPANPSPGPIPMATAATFSLASPCPSMANHNFQAPPPHPPHPHLQIPFPVYGLIPGFPPTQNGAAAAAAAAAGHHPPIPLQMYAVAPPPAAAAAALQLQNLAAAAVASGNSNGLQVFPAPPPPNGNVPGGHFNLTGGSLYQFGTAGIQLTPILTAPPPAPSTSVTPSSSSAATAAQLQAAAQAHAHSAAAVNAVLFGAAASAGVSSMAALNYHGANSGMMMPAGLHHHPQQHHHHAMDHPHHHHHTHHHHHHHHQTQPPLQHPPPLAPTAAAPPPTHGPGRHSAAAQRFLIAAYRVGMLALENLGRRIAEDRPQMKFARNPSYGDDVKWLLSISRKLGPHHIQSFLLGVMNTVVSPFLIQDLAYECARHLAMSQSYPSLTNPSYNSVVQQIRSHPQLSQLMTRCYQTYYQCIHQRLYHLSPSDYEEFVAVISHAKRAFQWTPEGLTAFQQLLQSIRRSKSCKKDLWQKILPCSGNVSNSSNNTGGNTSGNSLVISGGLAGTVADRSSSSSSTSSSSSISSGSGHVTNANGGVAGVSGGPSSLLDHSAHSTH